MVILESPLEREKATGTPLGNIGVGSNCLGEFVPARGPFWRFPSSLLVLTCPQVGCQPLHKVDLATNGTGGHFCLHHTHSGQPAKAEEPTQPKLGTFLEHPALVTREECAARIPIEHILLKAISPRGGT